MFTRISSETVHSIHLKDRTGMLRSSTVGFSRKVKRRRIEEGLLSTREKEKIY
jgi:hypothetical protein